MGFGPNDHFWMTSGFPGGGGTIFYEVGDEITMYYPIADAGEDVPAHPPTIPVEFDGSGSHHTDPNRKIVLYEWDFDGDGVYDYSSSDPFAEHIYPAYYNPDGSIDWDATAKAYTVYLRVTDDDPVAPKTDVDTCVVHITAPPWKPVSDPDGPYEGYVGAPVQLDGSKSYDPESKMFAEDHPWYETIATYEWDLDYDGEFDDATGSKPTHIWDNEGLYIIGLKVTDSQPSGPGGTIGPLDVDKKYTTVVIKKTTRKILPVPYYSQGVTNWCLPTSMSMIFKYYGQNIHSWDIAKDWGWRRDVAWWEFWDTWDMMAWNVESYFEAHGLVAEYIQYVIENPINFDTVSTWISTKGPVLLALTFPINHAVVVVGYNTADEIVYVNDPSGALLEEIFPPGELPDQPYTAVELSWSDIPIPWLSWAMVVEGTPSPPSGTIDIQDYGVRFWHRDRRWPPGVYSWLYGQDKGLIWEHSNDHPLALNSRDQFQFYQYIVNHMEDSQTYVLEIDFVNERVPLARVSGKGIWITYIWDTNNDGNIDYGNVGSILKRLKSAGVSWVIIKCGDSDSYWLSEGRIMNKWLKGSGYESFTQVINEFHNVGIKVFGGHYVYSYDKHNVPDLSEADVSNIILDIPGIDGLVIDAETEYEFAEESSEKAREYLSLIRMAHPHSFIAYTTFGNPRSHISFPYVEFGKYCNVAMPQVYWIDWGITPAEAVATMKAQWNELYENWERDGKSDSIKPIIPMGQSSDVTGTTPAKKGEITEFCKAVHKSGYEGVSIFRYGKMQKDHWGEYAKSLLPLCFIVSIDERDSKSNIMDPISLRDLLKYPGEYTVTLRLWNEDYTEKYDEVVFPSIEYSPLIEFYLASPADLYVTDPDGFHVGVDPSTGEVINEILGAVYTGQGSEPQIIAIPDPLDGNYEVLVIGTATGNYSLTIEFITLEETVTQTYTGEIVQGRIHFYTAAISKTGEMEVISWEHVFEDERRGTMLKISTNDKLFQFLTPDKDYGIREATYMRVRCGTIFIYHKDTELRLISLANVRIDFCVAIAWDRQTRTRYFLIDKVGIEE